MTSISKLKSARPSIITGTILDVIGDRLVVADITGEIMVKPPTLFRALSGEAAEFEGYLTPEDLFLAFRATKDRRTTRMLTTTLGTGTTRKVRK